MAAVISQGPAIAAIAGAAAGTAKLAFNQKKAATVSKSKAQMKSVSISDQQQSLRRWQDFSSPKK